MIQGSQQCVMEENGEWVQRGPMAQGSPITLQNYYCPCSCHLSPGGKGILIGPKKFLKLTDLRGYYDILSFVLHK